MLRGNPLEQRHRIAVGQDRIAHRGEAELVGEHGPRRVVCMISVGNEPSVALAGKLGFAPMRDTVLPDGDAVTLFERLPT